MAAKGLTKGKAREILSHGEVKGKPITPAQRGLFGAVSRGKSRMMPGGRVRNARSA